MIKYSQYLYVKKKRENLRIEVLPQAACVVMLFRELKRM